MKKSKNRLSAEDLELWKKVADSTNPLTSTSPLTFTETVAKPAKLAVQKPNAPSEKPKIPQFRVGERTSSTPAWPKPPSNDVQMDKRAYSKLVKGKTKPEARIDLHGMIVPEAQEALTTFLLRAKSDGLRLVLVITGKGKQVDDWDPMPRQTGVLRRQVPIWLGQAPLKQLVLQTTPAHQRHGGSGALYVYLRR